MKLRNVVTGTLVLSLFFLAGCGGEEGGGAKGDPIVVAEQFMDLYYHKANIQEAKALATPETAQKIEPAPGSPAGDASKEKETGQEIAYTLKEKSMEGKHSYALYLITITRKDAEPIYKTTALFIDLVEGAWKITLFDEKIHDGPHQEVTKG